MDRALVYSVIDRFNYIKEDLEESGLESYFEELFESIQSGSFGDIQELENILSSEQLEFLKDFDYEFYSLLVK